MNISFDTFTFDLSDYALSPEFKVLKYVQADTRIVRYIADALSVSIRQNIIRQDPCSITGDVLRMQGQLLLLVKELVIGEMFPGSSWNDHFGGIKFFIAAFVRDIGSKKALHSIFYFCKVL